MWSPSADPGDSGDPGAPGVLAPHQRTVQAAAEVVVEDALAAVEAGRRRGFALVVGVDRTAGTTAGAADLRGHGVNVVVRDLSASLLPTASGEV